jgi:protein SCO1
LNAKPLVFLTLLAACARPELPVLGTLPDFRLVAEDGEAFGAAELKGAPWAADFVYTSCPGPCPALSARMAALQARLPASVRLVSVTVDPERDRPEVLRAYARRLGAEAGRWRFLTGKRDAVRRLISEGFKLPVADQPAGLVAHSEKFALVDAELRLRGYYDGNDEASLKRLERDAGALAARR